MLSPDQSERIRQSAKSAFSHIPETTMEEWLVCMVSFLKNGINERNEAWRQNADLRQQITALQKALLEKENNT